MQRLCALMLAMVSALLLLAPLTAARSEQSLLPACCRRLGAHHCAQASTAMQREDRRHASLHATACLLMPRRSIAALQKLAGVPTLAGIAFLASWSAFSSADALEGYARALALKSPRGPPRFSLAL